MKNCYPRYRLVVVRNEVPRLLNAVFWRSQIHRIWRYDRKEKGCVIPAHWPYMIKRLQQLLNVEEANGPLWTHMEQHSIAIMGAMTLRRKAFQSAPLPEDAVNAIGCLCVVCDTNCPCAQSTVKQCGPQCHALPRKCKFSKNNLDKNICTNEECKVLPLVCSVLCGQHFLLPNAICYDIIIHLNTVTNMLWGAETQDKPYE